MLFGERNTGFALEELDLPRGWPRAKDFPEQVRRGVGDEPRLVEARRQNVAAPPAADQDLATAIAGTFEEERRRAPLGGKHRGQRSGGAGADHDDAPRHVVSGGLADGAPAVSIRGRPAAPGGTR